MEAGFSLKKYLRPKMSNILLGVILLALAVFAASYGFSGGDIVGIICFGILLATAIAVVCISISKIRSYSQEMKRLEEEGLYDRMENDFSNAETFFKDNLRLSDKYIYPKYGGKAQRYEDITKVYQYIQKKNGIENNRELRAATADGKIVTLADIALRGRDDDEVTAAVNVLLSKNPSIHVGYE